MKAYVDKDQCIGCGVCPTMCPEVFEMSGDSIAVVIGDKVPDEVKGDAVKAQESCPVDAIKVEE
ncbi:MAG: ferredoxin [Eubacteriales bacterium]